jgi:hypothetical protein
LRNAKTTRRINETSRITPTKIVSTSKNMLFMYDIEKSDQLIRTIGEKKKEKKKKKRKENAKNFLTSPRKPFGSSPPGKGKFCHLILIEIELTTVIINPKI